MGEPCHRDRGIVDEAIADHRRDRRLDGDWVGCDLGDLPGELTLARKELARAIRADFDELHGHTSSVADALRGVVTKSTPY
jgi:hypothetical protein